MGIGLMVGGKDGTLLREDEGSLCYICGHDLVEKVLKPDLLMGSATIRPEKFGHGYG